MLDLFKVTAGSIASARFEHAGKQKEYVGQPSCIGSTGLENIAASGSFNRFLSTSRALTLLMGVSEVTGSPVGVEGATSFSLPFVDCWRLSAGGLASGVEARSKVGIESFLILIDPGNFAGDVARPSFSVDAGCGLLLGFLLGEANANISSSSSNSSNRSFFLFAGAVVSGPGNGRCFFDATSFSCSFSMAMTSSSKSIEPSSMTGVDVVSTSLGFRPLGLTVVTVFGVAELLDGAEGVAREARFPPIFSLRLGVGATALVDAAGVAGALGGPAVDFA